VLQLPALPPDVAIAATYVAATIRALAREEHHGRRARRLLEPNLATWNRFRGRMGARDLFELVLEDAAVTQAEPFHAAAILEAPEALDAVPEALIADLLAAAPKLPLDASSSDYIEGQATLLGITARPALGDLRRIQAHDRVLELPGTGGRIAAHLLQTQPGLSLKDVFTIACGTWQERVLAGLVAVESGAVGEVRILLDPTLAHVRDTGITFTVVFGLKPEKGGLFADTRVNELLQQQGLALPILL
jgi:hypothetical protein